MNKFLLFLAAIMLLGFTANAQFQVMSFGFEESDLAGDYYFDTRDFEEGDVYEVGKQDASMARTGSGLLFVENTGVRVNPWLRAAKLRNLPIAEQTSYRFSYWVKGTNTYDIGGGEVNCEINTSPMQGVDFTDTDLFGANNARFGRNESGFDSDNWTKKTVMFYYETAAMMQEYWDGARPEWGGEVLPEEYFFLFNFFTPGTFYVDDIELWESTIGGLYFNENTIVVDFGYEIDIAGLGLNAENESVDYPVEALSVSVNGAAKTISYATLKNDARLYIALSSNINAADEVKVDFYNPIGDPNKELSYSTDRRPEAFNAGSTGEVLNFYGEIGVHDASVEASEVEGNNVAENELASKIKVFANNGMLQIIGENSNPISVEIISFTGASLRRAEVNGRGTVSIQNYPKGIYLVQTVDQLTKRVQVTKVLF